MVVMRCGVRKDVQELSLHEVGRCQDSRALCGYITAGACSKTTRLYSCTCNETINPPKRSQLFSRNISQYYPLVRSHHPLGTHSHHSILTALAFETCRNGSSHSIGANGCSCLSHVIGSIGCICVDISAGGRSCLNYSDHETGGGDVCHGGRFRPCWLLDNERGDRHSQSAVDLFGLNLSQCLGIGRIHRVGVHSRVGCVGDCSRGDVDRIRRKTSREAGVCLGGCLCEC